MIDRTLFSEEHTAYRDSLRRFLEAEVVPHHADWEEQGFVDREIWTKAGANGFLCASMPEAYGGAAADKLYSVVQMEEVARVNATGLGFGLHSEIASPYINRYGSDAQKQALAAAHGRGEVIGAIAMTEPGAGSDLQSIRTTAIRDGDHYLLNGSKTYITNGHNSDLVIVVCKTDPSKGAKGTSLLLVEADRPGFSKGKRLKKLGLKAQDTSELFFDNVKVPAGNLLGREGEGFMYLMQELPWERMMIALRAVASAEAAVEWTLEYTRNRKAFGKPVYDLPDHPPQIGGMQDAGAGRQSLCRSVPRSRAAGRTRSGHCRDGQVLVHRHAVQGDRRVPAVARRQRLHAGVPDYPGLRRCARAAHLRRHQRDHEGSDPK
jgi:alkylation response protein AidB-like acyl-CoA dehydrogenase